MLLPAAALAAGAAPATWGVLYRTPEEVVAADWFDDAGTEISERNYVIGPLSPSEGAVTVIGAGGAVLAAAALLVLAVLAATRRIGGFHLATAVLLLPLGAVAGAWWTAATEPYPTLDFDPGFRLLLSSVPLLLAGFVLLIPPLITLLIAGKRERARAQEHARARAQAHWQAWQGGGGVHR